MVKDEAIFLTGFPGFIASRLVKRMAQKSPAHFLLLVQPVFAGRALAEIERIAEETGSSIDRFQIVEGDITKENLGLSAEAARRIKDHTTFLFHLAAIYDLEVARDLAMLVNLNGTRNVNRFARTLPNLRRYHYVSTCYVAGKRTGLILETELEHSAGFRNYYEETKYLAEAEVEKLKSELPVTIHRPSVVCGHSSTGETAKYDGVYYLILYLLKQPNLLSLINIGNDHVQLNLVPVDFVVEGMVALLEDERAIGKTVQIADPAPLTTKELFETISKVLVGRGSMLTVPPPLVKTTLTLPVSPMITGLPVSGVPYFFIKQTYDTRVCRELLEPHGVRCPRFGEYVENLVGFVKEHPEL
jgi:nucleoside-diphosphate-sugar epimerase